MLGKENLVRPKYLERIRPFIDKPIIKVLIGQRRVGKSFILTQIIKLVESPTANIIYINKEDYKFDLIESYRDLIEFVEAASLPDKTNYLFIDEIQDIENFEKALRHLAIQPNMDIYITGSNANLLSGELATYLSGRYVEFKVFSLSYVEFLQFHEFENNTENLRKYLLWGGLPFLRNLVKEDNVIQEYLNNIFNTIIYKDVISRFQIRNTAFLERLVIYLANNVGSLISAKKISDFLKSQNVKMSPQIILNYLSYLRQAMLVFVAKRMDVKGKKVFEINDKYFFEDWGIMNALIGFDQMDIGKVIENAVYIHLQINGYKVSVGKLNNKEIDFVAEKSGKRVYLQVCYLLSTEEVRQREFGNLLEIKDNFPKMVVSLDEYAPKNVNGVEHFHLQKFLTEFE